MVDKAALNATINKAAAINLGLYTDDSANALRAALKKAREVSDNSNATQKQVDAAREALEKAIAVPLPRVMAMSSPTRVPMSSRLLWPDCCWPVPAPQSPTAAIASRCDHETVRFATT